MKKSPLRKKTRNLSEQIRKKCVILAKRIAVMLAGEKCEHCPRTKAQGWQMHGSHIYPEGVYKSMSADVDNILCLCATCHTGGFWKNSHKPSWHEDTVYFVDWFKNKYPERYEALKIKSGQSIQCDEYFWKKKLEILKVLYEEVNKKVNKNGTNQ